MIIPTFVGCYMLNYSETVPQTIFQQYSEVIELHRPYLLLTITFISSHVKHVNINSCTTQDTKCEEINQSSQRKPSIMITFVTKNHQWRDSNPTTDHQTAFDTITTIILWKTMRRRSVSKILKKATENVRREEELSESFWIARVRHGCQVSSILFTIYILKMEVEFKKE